MKGYKLLREMTKLDKAVSDCELLSNPDVGTREKFNKAVYNLGIIVMLKAMQGKIYEVKYNGEMSKVGKKNE